MALLDRIREKFGSDSRREFRYHCRDCDTEFRAPEQSRTNVACPECDATGPRHISKL